MGLAIEIFTNLFQAVMFTGFLYLFFDKPENDHKKIITFACSVIALFLITCYFTFADAHTGVASNYFDSLLYIVSLELYSLLCLKGKLYLRTIMPFVAFGVNAIISYTFLYFIDIFPGMVVEEALMLSTTFRYLCLAGVNLTTALFLWLILSFGSKKIKLTNGSEIVAFTIIPVLCIVIMYCNFFAYQVSGFNSEILPYLLVICIVMVTIAIITCVMLGRISKANELKTEYLLTAQREKLYEESIMASNEQIEKITCIKHETKNKMGSIKQLIMEQKLDEAVKLCDITLDNLKATYTPIYTSNPVLNAIVNVELEKASSSKIDFSVDISDTLSKLPSADTISLVGNLCDNAIEYLITQPEQMRDMKLRIHSYQNFYVITCYNKILSSVLKENPEWYTTKEDKENHGKGMSIVKKIAQTHNGDITCLEENGYLSVSVVVNCT